MMRRFITLAATTVSVLAPMEARAQLPVPQLAERAVEIGYLHEWFHRDFEGAILAETEWSLGSVALEYGVRDWLTLHVQGCASNFDAGDSYYDRLSVGAGISVRAYHSGVWSVSLNARIIDTFDHDQWANQFHKSVRTLAGAAQLGLSFNAWNQSGSVWAGPVVSDDDAELFVWDTHDPLEASAGLGWGAAAGGRVVLFGWIAVYGYATYIDELAGGAGISLHAGEGSF